MVAHFKINRSDPRNPGWSAQRGKTAQHTDDDRTETERSVAFVLYWLAKERVIDVIPAPNGRLAQRSLFIKSALVVPIPLSSSLVLPNLQRNFVTLLC